MMEMFHILIMVVVTQVCIYMSKLIAPYTLKIGLLLTCKLYFNKIEYKNLKVHKKDTHIHYRGLE